MGGKRGSGYFFLFLFSSSSSADQAERRETRDRTRIFLSLDWTGVEPWNSGGDVIGLGVVACGYKSPVHVYVGKSRGEVY